MSSKAPFRLTQPDRRVARNTVLRFAERLLALDQINDIYDRLPENCSPDEFLDAALAAFHLHVSVDDADLANVPLEGSAIVVANHPFGGVEGMLLARTLRRVRSDVKILANYLLTRMPQLAPIIVAADPFTEGARSSINNRAARDALAWLRAGHVLLVFPAGEVSHLHLRAGRIQDPTWNPSFIKMARRTSSRIVPVYIHGRNSAWFQAAGFIHPRLRTALLPRELINKANKRIRLSIGRALSGDRLARFSSDQTAAHWIREGVYLLGDNRPTQQREQRALQPITEATDPELIVREVEALSEEHWLNESGRFKVFVARADEIPHTLNEIARLREITFRAVGEGTGNARDRDLYDNHYLQLVLWDKVGNSIAGGYRLGLTDQVVARYGIRGLYTHSLFNYKKRLLDRLHPSIELGRSFVVLDHQRSFAPLMLLWRAVLVYVGRNPRYRYLFGPVSISSTYRTASQTLLVRFLQSHLMADELTALVRPKHPFRHANARFDSSLEKTEAIEEPPIELVGDLIQQMEGDGKSVPVLVRQYLKLGGRFLGFNVDTDFGDAVDCLIVVDLLHAEPKNLLRYMSEEHYQRLLDEHRVTRQLA